MRPKQRNKPLMLLHRVLRSEPICSAFEPKLTHNVPLAISSMWLNYSNETGNCAEAKHLINWDLFPVKSFQESLKKLVFVACGKSILVYTPLELKQKLDFIYIVEI